MVDVHALFNFMSVGPWPNKKVNEFSVLGQGPTDMHSLNNLNITCVNLCLSRSCYTYLKVKLFLTNPLGERHV